MIVLILLQVLVGVLAQENDFSNEIESRIMYGQPVKIEDYPYYAGLAGCGAAIISNVWILTAAHCVEDLRPNSYNNVWVGGETFSNSQKIPFGTVIIHEQYVKTSEGLPIHDIALIKLSKPLQFSKKVQPVKLPTSGVKSPKSVFVGRGTDETGKISKNLQKLNVLRLTSEQCINLLPRQYQAHARQNIKFFETINICAKRDGDGPSICFGDSGSPLVSGNEVIGLASYIGGKCDQVRLAFYVNVVTYLPWIKAKTGL